MVIKHVVLPWNTAWWPSRFLLSSIFSVAYQLKWNIYMTFKLENSSIASSRHSSLQLTSSLSGLQKKRARGDVMKVQLNVMKVWHLFVCHVFVTPHRCDVFVCWHFSSLLRSRSFSRPLNDMPRGLLSQSVSVFFSFFYVQIEKMHKEQVDENIPIMVSKNRELDWSTTIKRGEVFGEWSIVVLGWSKKKKGKKKKGGCMGHFVEERKEEEDKEKEGEQQQTDKMARGHREKGEQRRCCRSLAPELTAAVSPLSSHHSSSGYCSSAWASWRPLVSTARLLMSRSCYTHTHTHR